ncbi:MAG: M14 family metallopeptidase [Bacteroidaceae bacterium]
MTIKTIFTMSSPYRDDFRIKAYTFGHGEKTLAIIGTMRGDEIQQQYVAARLVNQLVQIEQSDKISPGISISMIPSVNPFSMNIEKRFWALDNTDINRMFPGYHLGETTQRIAAALFEYVQDYKYGVQLASYYLPGNFIPHVRLIDTSTDSTNTNLGKAFGFPYVTHSKPDPFDTVLLNYNWQIWNTQAFSLYAGSTETIEPQTARQAIEGIMRFMVNTNILTDVHVDPGVDSQIINENIFHTIQSPHAGILTEMTDAGQRIYKDQTLASIMHPYEGRIVAKVTSPCNGTIFFARNKSITYQNTVLFRIIPK